MNLSATSTDVVSNPPGLPRKSMIKVRIPSPCNFQSAASRSREVVLEAGQLEVGDTVGAVEDSDIIDARHFDLLTTHLNRAWAAA